MALPPRKINFDDVYGPINAADAAKKADLRLALGLNDPPEGALSLYIDEDHSLTSNDKPLLRVSEVLADGRVVLDPADIDIGEYPPGEDFAVVGYRLADPTDQVLIPASDIGAGGGSFTAATAAEAITGTNNTKGITPLSLASQWLQGTAIASAGTITIPDTGAYFHITGTTTITDVDFTTTTAGRRVELTFDGALVFTHHATNLICITGTSITTAAGDTCVLRSEGGDIVRMIDYTRKDGSALNAPGGGLGAATNTEQLTGTTTAKASTPDSVAALWEKGSDIASAATLTIGEGGYFVVTGTTTITAITVTTDKSGRMFDLRFSGALTLTNGANLACLTGASIVTAVGDVARFRSEGSGAVRMVGYARADGSALTGSGGGGGVGPIQGEIYAHEMTASITSGATPIFAETATNQRMIVAWAFDSAVDQYVQATIGLPKRYDNSSLTFQFHWTHETTNATASVTWCAEALATGNGDAINAAWGTAQRVVDDGGTAETHYISGQTPALTSAGTHIAGDTTRLRFSRDVDGNGTAANDDLAQPAWLERVTYWYTSSASTDA